MLVLSRKPDEKIIIKHGDEIIELTVVRIEPGKVRLGIKAGPDVVILREELVENKPTTSPTSTDPLPIDQLSQQTPVEPAYISR